MTNVFFVMQIIAFFLAIFDRFHIGDTHGMLLEPVARGSRWRFNHTALTDYDDNQGFCGGFYVQWQQYNGKCGLCGDSFAEETPRPHEFGGLYGDGIIVRNYSAGSFIPLGVRITANHYGYFLFHICNLDEQVESEECFDENPLELLGGAYRFEVESSAVGWYNTSGFLPETLNCEHCVLRWTYVTGNSWGECDEKSGAIGCGAQEQFKGCADISIRSNEETDYESIFPEIENYY